MRKTMCLCAIIVWSVLISPLFAFQNETTPPGDERPSGKHHGRSASERWKQMDQDNDQRISRSEWKGNEEVFKRLDSDGDGALTREELQAGAKAVRGKHGAGFQKMDENGDGNISRSEWKRSEEVFNQLDTNADGVLTREELKQARQKYQGRPSKS
ncbi:MAG TPA: EF-hand domain-containing protein [Terriglobia bacterium]|nr:EF-hand domain-containing protein [Terriglobia bacterium]